MSYTLNHSGEQVDEAVGKCSCYIEKHNKTRQGQPAPPLFRAAEGR